jgi:serine protease inhibitor
VAYCFEKSLSFITQATMDVTPGGVEAAAATGITITLYSAFVPDVEVKIDRPFMFFIVEKPTNMILFSGFVNDPRN